MYTGPGRMTGTATGTAAVGGTGSLPTRNLELVHVAKRLELRHRKERHCHGHEDSGTHKGKAVSYLSGRDLLVEADRVGHVGEPPRVLWPEAKRLVRVPQVVKAEQRRRLPVENGAPI